MRKLAIVAVGLLLLGSVGHPDRQASSAGSSAYLAAAILSNAGSITGIVRCGEPTTTGETAAVPAPRPWSTVWVSGRSFSARTDGQGVFRIDYVPPGTYTLGVQTAGMPIRAEFTGVTVFPRAVTDVGFLDVTGGCGQCGGHGGSGGCEDGGGCDDGGGCQEGDCDGSG